MKESMHLLKALWTSLGGAAEYPAGVEITGEGDLPSVFAVTDLAAASIGAAGLAIAELVGTRNGKAPEIRIDRRLASMWFGFSIRPIGWTLPPVWDAIAGDYEAGDGWIKLHTNAPAHREAAIAVLGVPAAKDAVAAAVRGWKKEELETAIVAQGGCAAAMRSVDQWRTHPQGRAVGSEPLFHIALVDNGANPAWSIPRERPLHGIRVLDLTRVLAGPVATRLLAGLGAEILRIDPPGWEEPAIAPEVTLGKRCARLDLRDSAGRRRFEVLLGDADVLVHGYRPDSLARLGFDSETRRALRPGLIDVSLDAYGWTGPWATRRGYDSLVQMSSGIADAGMRVLDRGRPTPLPVQALDHSTGYLLAAAAIRGITRRLSSGQGSEVRTSLARVATLLSEHRINHDHLTKLAPETDSDLSGEVEDTTWGLARRLLPPLTIDHTPIRWDRAASALGSSDPAWCHQS